MTNMDFFAQPLRRLLSPSVKKPERIFFASTCAHAFLGLQATTWTPLLLNKETVTIIESKSQSSNADREAYLFYNFNQNENPSEPLKSSSLRNQSLLALGILILELLFGETLEQQPFRTKYLSNGQPNRFTDLCTAKEWCEQVAFEFGDELSRAVEFCIDGGVRPSASSSSVDCLQAQYDEIIQPLDRFLALFSGWTRV